MQQTVYICLVSGHMGPATPIYYRQQEVCQGCLHNVDIKLLTRKPTPVLVLAPELLPLHPAHHRIASADNDTVTRSYPSCQNSYQTSSSN